MLFTFFLLPCFPIPQPVHVPKSDPFELDVGRKD